MVTFLPPSLSSPGQSFPYASQEMSQSFIVPVACAVALGSQPRKKDFRSIISAIYCTVCSVSSNFSFSAFHLSALRNGMIDINIFSLIIMYFPFILVLVIHYSVFLLNKSHWFIPLLMIVITTLKVSFIRMTCKGKPQALIFPYVRIIATVHASY